MAMANFAGFWTRKGDVMGMELGCSGGDDDGSEAEEVEPRRSDLDKVDVEEVEVGIGPRTDEEDEDTEPDVEELLLEEDDQLCGSQVHSWSSTNS